MLLKNNACQIVQDTLFFSITSDLIRMFNIETLNFTQNADLQTYCSTRSSK